MSRFNTGNPLGSGSPLDLDDNAKNMDEAVNAEQDTFQDRLGKSRLTWTGMENQFDAGQASREQEFDAGQASREQEFDAGQADRDHRFDAFIESSGYQFVGDYAAGIELTEYNQLIRDLGGEFWRVSGPTQLPYTTTGSGLPEGGAFVPVGDAALRQQLARPDGYRLVANQLSAAAYGAPASLVNIRVGVDAPTVVSYFHGYFWGTRSGNIERSSDGESWEVYSAISGGIPMKIIPTSDGEVLVLATDSRTIRKSTNWASGSPTWSVSLQGPTPGGENPILRWGFDGSGSKFIVTHYGSGGNGSTAWENSRYVWISTDAGDTWDIVWDTQERFPESFASSHIHAACYDQWADRFYFTEGHGTPHGMYYSDDDGANWTKIQNIGLSPAPTVLVPTDFGIVMGTDSEPNGVAFLPRSHNPDDVGVQMLATVSSYEGRGGVLGFADVGMRDPDTGIVYIGFNSEFAGVPSTIFAVGSGGASIVYESVGGGGPGVINRFSNVVAAKGKLLATHNVIGRIVSDVPPYTQQSQPFDRGNLFPEVQSTRQLALAIGRKAVASGLNSLSVGADVSGQDCVAVGYRGTVTGAANSTAVGNLTSASANATAVGFEASASSNGTAYGHLANAGEGGTLAVGRGANASSVYAVSVGYNAAATGSYSLSLGSLAQAQSPQTLAAGYQAAASGAQATALGAGASVTGGNGVAVGYSSSATSGGVSVGRQAVSLSEGVAAGHLANAAIQAVSIGWKAEVGAQGGIAIGRLSKVGLHHASSVAIGQSSETQRANSLCVGDRDIESTRSGGRIILKSPDGTAFAITVSNSGAISATSI